jgi:hypothetical protein
VRYYLDDPSPDTGNYRILEDSTTFGGSILLTRCPHEGIDGGIGTAEFHSQVVNAEGLLT